MAGIASKLPFLAIYFAAVATAAPVADPSGPFYWPLNKPPGPPPAGYNTASINGPFTEHECEVRTEPFKAKVEDCLFVPYDDAPACVRSKLTLKEWHDYNTLFRYGCGIPGKFGDVRHIFTRRDADPGAADINLSTIHHWSTEDEFALPNITDYLRAVPKHVGPPLTPEQCDSVERSFIGNLIHCGLEPKEKRFQCALDSLTRREWRTFKEAVLRGCQFQWMKGDLSGSHIPVLARRDEGEPDTHRPPWMDSWNGDHWDAWEKFVNVKLKDFVINKLDKFTIDIPADWLLHYPFTGGKGRVGTWGEEHRPPRHDMAHDGKAHSWRDIFKRSAPQILDLKQHNPYLSKASTQNNMDAQNPTRKVNNNQVPSFEGRRCHIVDPQDNRVTYQDAQKDEHGYVRVKCKGPEISPFEQRVRPDDTRPTDVERDEIPAVAAVASAAADQQGHHAVSKRDGDGKYNGWRWDEIKQLPPWMVAIKMSETDRYGKLDEHKIYDTHWSDEPVYYKNHNLAQDCYRMVFHETAQTCYMMWKPGTG